MQHVLVALQQEKSSSCSNIVFVISPFGCPPCSDARGRRPVRYPPLQALLSNRLHSKTFFDVTFG